MLSALAAAIMLAPAALAEQAEDWQIGMQPGVTPVRDQIDFLHDDILLPIISVITVFVLGLLLYTILRFNARRHPTPSQTSHNTLIEVIWTTVPILILLVIFIPSIKLLYYVDRTQHADMTLKVTGHQWYWSYEYPDQGDVSFDSTMIPEEDQVKRGLPRLLEVDNPVVLPVGATVRILVTGTDVIHSWFVPATGVQEYAVVGRTNESWMRLERAGTYYGQCNQICGLNHPFMPIEIKAVDKGEFGKWLACQKKPPKEGCGEFTKTADRKDGAGAPVLASARPAQ
ncbi:MAG TPA: cytochrome c oxidase subunit II [Stellaceae bacterium]|nr:cytochrome c oxidase subunit II [Stellaceae bacterium]